MCNCIAPRFDADKGNWDKAESIVQTIAEFNCTTGSHIIKFKRGETTCDHEANDKIGFIYNSGLNFIKATGRMQDFVVS